MSDAIVLYPRALVNITAVLNNGNTVDTVLWPDSVNVSLRAHHQCSECDVVVKQSALPFDPRQLNGVFVTVFLGAMSTVARQSDNDPYVQQPKYLIFAGYADSMEVVRSSEGPRVSIKARDLSSFFRDEKNLFTKVINGIKIDPIPRYSDTPLDSIKRIYQWAGLTEDQLSIDDQSNGQRASSTSLSVMVSSKGQGARIPLKSGSTAWEAIEHVAALANLLVSIDRGSLVVREPQSAFGLKGTNKVQPSYQFVFGENPHDGYQPLQSITLKKKFLRNRKGVRLIGYDPVARKSITADYPDDSKLPPKKRAPLGPHKQKKSVSHSSTPRVVQEPDREIFPVGDIAPGIHSQDQLQQAAQRLYMERSRQEIEGELSTVIWDDGLLALGNASRVEIRIKPELETALLNISDRTRQITFLKERLNLNDKAASSLVDAIHAKDSSVFYVRSIVHNWSPEGADTKIDFIGILEADLTGGA